MRLTSGLLQTPSLHLLFIHVCSHVAATTHSQTGFSGSHFGVRPSVQYCSFWAWDCRGHSWIGTYLLVREPYNIHTTPRSIYKGVFFYYHDAGAQETEFAFIRQCYTAHECFVLSLCVAHHNQGCHSAWGTLTHHRLSSTRSHTVCRSCASRKAHS